MRLTALLTFVYLTFSVGVQSALAEDPHGYLALGDSLAFGFNPLVAPPNLSNYHGYPEFVAQGLHLDHKLANASCFGETSSHFLNRASLPDLGCEQWRSGNLPMFVSYPGSQLNYAVQYLRDHDKTKLVTIDIGINDLAVLAFGCGAFANPPAPNAAACVAAGLGPLLLKYAANLEAIYSGIRATGYDGPIVAVTGYAPNYADAAQVQAIAAFNFFLTTETAKFGGKIADAFTDFGAASAPFGGNVCQTGLLVKLPNGTCDTHPSAAGQALIAKLIMHQIAKSNSSEGGNNNQGDNNQSGQNGSDR
jgi:lysophospholipase L1-like esterase